MLNLIKNIAHECVRPIAGEVMCQPGQIVSKTLAQSKHQSLTLFAFGKGEEIGTHESDGDAMVIALDGMGKITIDGTEYILNSDDTIVMPAKKPHAVFAEKQSKMLLIVFFGGGVRNESDDSP